MQDFAKGAQAERALTAYAALVAHARTPRARTARVAAGAGPVPMEPLDEMTVEPAHEP